MLKNTELLLVPCDLGFPAGSLIFMERMSVSLSRGTVTFFSARGSLSQFLTLRLVCLCLEAKQRVQMSNGSESMVLKPDPGECAGS